MLGSYNSCTYLPCRKWWMYLINWAVKCQSKSLSEQFLQGVRYFDIRLKYDKRDKNKWIISHGIVEYKADINDILNTLNNLAAYTGERVYVRFLLEYNEVPDDFATKILNLQGYVGWARGTYSHLTFHCIMLKWNEYVTNNYIDVGIHHFYSSTLGWKRLLWIPYLYAKLHNRKFKKENKELLESKDQVMMLDFINV